MPRFIDILIEKFLDELRGSNWWSLTQNSQFALNLLKFPRAKIGIAEGDSWFDYRFTSKFIHGTGEDLIGHLCENGELNVVRLSFAGDTLEGMSGEPQLTNFRKVFDMLRESHFAKPDFVIFSGGGNDMAGEGGVHLKTILTPTGLDRDKVRQKFDELMSHFRTMIGNVRSVDAKIPIFLHGYAYPIPDRRKVEIPIEVAHHDVYLKLAGPWLKPAFDGTQITEVDQQKIVIELIDLFNETLGNLANEFENVFYIDLRGCLPKPPYSGYQEDWANELHPTSEGFRKIAKSMKKVILDHSK